MADALPLAAVVHTMKGRTRLRVADRREDEGFFASVAAGLSAIAGVQKVEVRPLTGGILIFHDTPLSTLSAAAEKAGLFSLVEETIASSAPEELRLQISPRMVMAAGLGLIAVWQVYKEHVFPPALTLAFLAAEVAGLSPVWNASVLEE